MANYCKYKKEILQVSYNNGVTWSNVTPESARTGDLIEISSSDCGYVPPTPTGYSTQYLTLIPVSTPISFNFRVSSDHNAYYSLDSGSTWASITSGESTPSVAVGQKIMWKASGLPVSPQLGGSGRFISNKLYDVEGNIMSMVSGDSFVTATTIPNDYQFYAMFAGSNVRNAENLVLPATTLKSHCYDSMFEDCANLTTAPTLPSTSLAEGCYYDMFWDCISLTTAPALPATTLAPWCYDGMFQGCTSLITAPALPATTLAELCYSYMFSGCTSLTTAPTLPATTLAGGCYFHMFEGCTSLTIAPELPATTMTTQCYDHMFNGCTNLIYIKCLATNISANSCTSMWLYGVASSGTFVKNASMSSWTSGSDGIPTNWTVYNAT